MIWSFYNKKKVLISNPQLSPGGQEEEREERQRAGEREGEERSDKGEGAEEEADDVALHHHPEIQTGGQVLVLFLFNVRVRPRAQAVLVLFPRSRLMCDRWSKVL